MKKNVSADPSLPYVEVILDGETYKACFDFESLATAEDELLRRGHADANLLFRLPNPTFSNVRVIFAAALLAYQPELDFEDAKKLVTPRNLHIIANAMYSAWTASMPDPEKKKGPRKPE